MFLKIWGLLNDISFLFLLNSRLSKEFNHPQRWYITNGILRVSPLLDKMILSDSHLFYLIFLHSSSNAMPRRLWSLWGHFCNWITSTENRHLLLEILAILSMILGNLIAITQTSSSKCREIFDTPINRILINM